MRRNLFPWGLVHEELEQLQHDDRWPETKSGTVVRRYFHLRGANDEMRYAIENGWTVQEVMLNGAVVPVEAPRLFRWPGRARLVQDRRGTLKLTAGSAANGAGDWHPQNRKMNETDVQVTYTR